MNQAGVFCVLCREGVKGGLCGSEANGLAGHAEARPTGSLSTAPEFPTVGRIPGRMAWPRWREKRRKECLEKKHVLQSSPARCAHQPSRTEAAVTAVAERGPLQAEFYLRTDGTPACLCSSFFSLGNEAKSFRPSTFDLGRQRRLVAARLWRRLRP